MPRQKKKENLVHFDLDALAKETAEVKAVAGEETDATVGEILKAARTERKLQIADVAQQLRIKEIYLEALEEGHYRSFPGRAYGVGFLRSYALFLGLDAKALVAQFNKETADMAQEPLEMPIPENHNVLPSKKTVLWSLGVLLVVYLIWSLVVYFTKPEPVEPVIAAPVVEDVKSETVTAETENVETEATEPPVEAPVESDTLLDNSTEKNEKPQMQADVVAAPKVAKKVYGTGDGKVLAFVANAEVWLEVKDGEKVLFSKVLHAQDRYHPAAGSEGWVLKTGNAGAVEVFVNGKSKGLLGESGAIKSDVALDAKLLAKGH